jgi:hypothetical protein
MSNTSQRWFASGMGFIGAAIGFLVAESGSPVVAVALPLIFGLIGGAGGLYVARADISSESGSQRLALIGKSISAFSAALIAVTIAVILTQRDYSAGLTKVSSSSELSALDFLNLAELRARLKILGSSPEEQQDVLARAIQNKKRSTDPVEIGKRLKTISEASLAVIKVLSETTISGTGAGDKIIGTGTGDKIGLAIAASAPHQVSENLANLKLWLQGLQPLMSKWADDLAANRPVSPIQITKGLDDLRTALSTALEKPSPQIVLAALGSHLDVEEKLISLEIALIPTLSQSTEDYLTSGRSSNSNQLLQMILGADPTRLRDKSKELVKGFGESLGNT